VPAPQVAAAFNESHGATRRRNFEPFAQSLAALHLQECLVTLERPLKQEFDTATGWFGAREPCGDDTSIVEYQQIVWQQKPRQIADHPIGAQPGASIEHEKPARGALGKRRLSDPIGRYVVGEVMELHARMLL
jgi:hypothetical protein